MKNTKVGLDFCTDAKRRLFFENNMKGGLASVMGSRFIWKWLIEETYNLGTLIRGYTMSENLPTERLHEIKISNLDMISNINQDNEIGYTI